MSDKLVRLTIRLPEKLNKQLDDLVKEGRYSSKAEIIREALREFLEKLETPEAIELTPEQAVKFLERWLKEKLR